MAKFNIYLAEDHSVVRAGIRMLIDAQPDMKVIGEAGDGATAFREILELLPDIVVLDITLPKMNGGQVTEALKRKKPEIKVLALSVHEESTYLKELFKAGVSGYVLKRSAADELINAIRAVAEGKTYLDPSATHKIIEDFSNSEQVVDQAAQEARLSQRETEVLKMIARGFSNKEIASDLQISVKTVETYKSRAMQKVNLTSRADIVRFAVQQQWLQDDD